MAKPRNVDPILASIIERRLINITREMGYTMLRTTRSPILNQARDFVTGIFDEEGRQLAQTEYIPIISCMWPAIKETLKLFDDDIYPGDVFLFNDTFYGGNQLADVMTYKPVFYNEEMVGWVAAKGHVADIGGAVAGGYNPQATEVWQEGLRIPPVKIIERGKTRKDVWRLIFDNVRYEIVAEDIKSFIGACTVGERGLLSLISTHGLDKFREHVSFILDSTERRVRSWIRQIPEGVYEGESHNDHDVDRSVRLVVKVKVIVKHKPDGELIFDFTGSSPQSKYFTNGTWVTTYSATLVALYYLLDPDIPHNEGVLRCFKVIVPEGTVLNAKFPAATGFGNHTCGDNIPMAIFKALAPVLKHKVTAEWCRWFSVNTVGIDPRTNEPYVDIAFFAGKGGGGACEGCDGWDHIGFIRVAGALASQDVEMMEAQDPHILLKHELITDSGGPGRWRGGLGVHSVWLSYAKEGRLVVWGDGTMDDNRPFGLFDGHCSPIANEGWLREPGKEPIKLENFSVYSYEPGSIIEIRVSGGGGFGDPLERSPEEVREDVLNEKVSIEAARRDYGVIIDPETLEIDYVETERLRKMLKSSRSNMYKA